MGSKTEVTLRNFFIFNTRFGPREGEELKKILYYHPITDNIDVQIKNVGLVEGIIQFTGTFKPSHDVNSLHTQKSRQLYFQPEKHYWMVMTLNVPIVEKVKDGVNQSEYIEGDVQDNVYEAVLQQAYYMYQLFNDKFTIEPCDLGALKTKLEHFFNAYLKSIKLAHADILNVFSGIQYLPLDKLTFLKVQCFINLLECNYPDVLHTAFLYNDHLIWSGPDPSDMKTIYQYLLGTLLPANVESELQGGSMPRHSVSPFAALHHGRFITGPTNLKSATTVGKLPKVYLFSNTGDKPSVYHMVVYRALSASVCLFVNVEAKLTISFFKELDEFINQQLTTLVCDIAEYCSKQVITPSNIPENVPRFIYFNKLNSAYKSTAHLDSKQSGNVICPKDPLKIIADLNGRKGTMGHSGDTIVKTMNDYWVFAKNSNMREFYVVLQQKNASLIEISDILEALNAEMMNRDPRNHG